MQRAQPGATRKGGQTRHRAGEGCTCIELIRATEAHLALERVAVRRKLCVELGARRGLRALELLGAGPHLLRNALDELALS